MKLASLALAIALPLATLAGANAASAQSTRVYREGPVILVSFIRTKPGMFDRYMEYLNSAYKTTMEAEKAAGIITGYSIFTSAPRDPADHDVLLTVVYKNWAALDNLQDRTEPVSNRVLQNTSRQRDQQFIERGAMRDIIGQRVYQELLLK